MTGRGWPRSTRPALVDQDDDVGLDLACMNFEERARYLMGL